MNPRSGRLSRHFVGHLSDVLIGETLVSEETFMMALDDGGSGGGGGAEVSSQMVVEEGGSSSSSSSSSCAAGGCGDGYFVANGSLKCQLWGALADADEGEVSQGGTQVVAEWWW